MQNIKTKKWGVHGILCPPIWKSGGTRPPCPHHIATIMSIHGDVKFISQLKYKTHVAVIEKFTFMTSILNAVAQFHYYLEK